MADPTHWVKHIESYVDSASSPAQQATTVDAIATLLKKDVLSLEALIKEMELYLTTTDSIIRARGILLLAEVLTHLASKPLDDATVHSLIGFFTERLADWKALRGALVGCLALMERKRDMGMISGSEARAVAESFLQNIQVQSLAQYDRKICFELLNCLLDRFPDAAVAMGDLLTYAICEAIDGEKDPQCLMLAFHVVEVLAQIFASPSGSLASYAEELFNIFGCYFPIHFTHSKGEDVEVKREELSRALMLAFASTPLFEPFAIPLLLEKLSSSLPSAKLESLRYLNYCTLKYGKDRMVKHAKALWLSLKDAIYNLQNSSFSLESETLHGKGSEENEMMTEALLLLQKIIQQNDESLLNLILGDEDIVGTMKYVASYNDHGEISTQIRQRLHAAGSILSASVKASIASCNRVFESFFPTLMDAMCLSTQISPGGSHINYDSSARLNNGALYLIVELLSACRCLVVGPDGCNVISVSKLETWCCLLHNSCSSLTEAFNFTLLRSMHEGAHDAHIQCGVKGMQILATFPGSFFPVSKSIFENILTKLMSIITLQFNKVELWKLVLRTLVEIGSFIDKLQESEKAASFDRIVVERIISLMSCDASTMPLYLKVEAISDIGMTGLNFMLRIIQGVEKVISANFTEAYIHGNVSSVELTVQLLEFYTSKVLPWLESVGGSEEVPLHFVVSICDQIGETYAFKTGFQEEKLPDATMMAVKHAVGNCSEKSQSIIIQKAFTILSSSSVFLQDESMSGAKLVKLETLQVAHSLDCFSCRDDWIISLVAAVIIALRPQTHIPNVKVVLQLFMTTALFGHIPSAQALGSLMNKLPLKLNASNYCSLEEAMDMIFNSSLWCHCGDGLPKNCPHKCYGNEVDHSSSSFRFASSKLYQVHNIVGLAWIGKGLLLRGHETVKDITMTILSCLMPNIGSSALPLEQGTMCQMKAAADAFHIIMGNSEACLNSRFHATMKPLYKQRFFNIVIPFLLSAVGKSDSSHGRLMIYRAIAHVVSNTPLSAVVSEAKKLIPVLIDGLSNFREDILNSDIIYNILLVLSGILMDKNGLEAAIEHAHIVINSLVGLASYPHMVLVRETAIQCLVAMSVLPHARIYPMRIQVLRAMSNALDDPKRVVRQEAVRCRQAWASIASRSLHF